MQTDIEQVAVLLEEFADARDDVSALAGLPEASQWILWLRDDSTIVIDYVREEARLCLSADLGTSLGAHRDSVYAAMPFEASLRATNGGISLALSSPDEDCQVLIDVSTHDLTPPRFGQAFQRFIAGVRTWTQVVRHGLHVDTPRPDAVVHPTVLA
ncbi:MAG: type III secretion system chaperone [Gammaproteobacteria bacterium]